MSHVPGRDTVPVHAVVRSVRASDTDGARKNTQATFTNKNVSAHWSHAGRRARPPPPARSAIGARPWRAPHTKNVHPAPCQKPLTRYTIKMLRYARQAPRRLPPKGK